MSNACLAIYGRWLMLYFVIFVIFVIFLSLSSKFLLVVFTLRTQANMTEEGFVKAQSNNIPRVDSFMVAAFFSTQDCFVSAETKGAKAERSGRETYGDAAVGYVQLKREANVCILKAKICPEHKVRAKNYDVYLEVDEVENVILRASCLSCVEGEGGCKHVIAFIMWCHRRSEEPSTTEVECYWRKSKLAEVGTSLKYIRAEDFGVAPVVQLPNFNPGDLLNAVIRDGISNKSSSQLLKYYKTEVDEKENLNLHYLLHAFCKEGGGSAEKFLEFAKIKMTHDICSEACAATVKQSKSPLWHNLRYGRVTASKAYEVSRCKKVDGVLVETIIGSMQVPETKLMQRGRILEQNVLEVLKQENQNLNFESVGLLLSPELPFMGASPDSLTEEYVIEIKCPSNEKSFQNYIKDGKVTQKFYAQIQLQMHFFKKEKGLFCVADPSFETNKKIHSIIVDYEESFVEDLIDHVEVFWKKKHLSTVNQCIVKEC